MNNEQLVACVQAGENEKDNMLQLWQNCERFVRKLAVKYTYGAELEDLIHEGYIALCEVVQHYDVSSGVPFINYAAFWFKQRFRRYVENCGGTVRIPVGALAEVRKYKKTAGEFQKYYGREATDKEMRALLHVSEEKLDQIKKSVQIGRIRSLSEPIVGEDEDITLEDAVPSGEHMEDDAVQRIDRESMQREVWAAVDTLPEKEGAVVRCMYEDGRTLKETSELIGMNYAQAADTKKKAFQKLKRKGNCQKYGYKTYYEVYLAAAPVHHIGAKTYQNTWTSEVERDALRRFEKSFPSDTETILK